MLSVFGICFPRSKSASTAWSWRFDELRTSHVGSEGPEGRRHVGRGVSPWLATARYSPKPQEGDIPRRPRDHAAPPGLKTSCYIRPPGARAPGYTTEPRSSTRKFHVPRHLVRRRSVRH